ncbi:presqualene diphosphate synthase HpnD [Methylobacillus flagellatus]|uniref:Squalene/phytoene synthase n=1 Tax=Methylobacillus flagellatus (strain ATCC 51484 / DSM 6875 / VKM B-1610 / KT) TaxID=265072 RepID=Q1H1A0_METFK|nr:presqualene diphosphate synthase HpnD [Methylobacillus flagellatus]ABE49737.1 Squalene/phytoene synthase [Methylobacillus flagellatus KT]
MSPQEYCQNKAAASGSSFYYSFLFLPKAKREAITALYAFCREVDDIADDVQDVNVAQTKLNWWRSEIINLFEGKPQHPVTMALQSPVRELKLKQQHFLEIINGMQMDLEQNRYRDFEELELYCYRVASVVGLLSASIFGYSNPQTLQYALDLGMAFQLTNITRDVGEDGRRGRIYLPLDEISRFGVSEQDILQGKASDNMRQLLEFQVERAERYYEKALAELPLEDRKQQRTGLIMASIYRTLLKEIKRDDIQVVLNARVSLTPIRKLWLAWLTWIRN